ncbi:MAG: hypothetical protein NC311_01115 [Muribaculaceae bacterium]|nr:hypothetical protein [Muribaculaceae bacterium]
MKKYLITITMAIITINSEVHAKVWIPNFGYCNEYGGTCPTTGHWQGDSLIAHCINSTCYCISEEDDTKTITVPCKCEEDDDCNSGYGCVNAKCVKCTSCSNCTSDTSWSAYGTGYQRITYRTCACNGTCNTSYSYRCAAGYYGSSTNGTSGCTQCPTWTGVYTTSAKTTLVRGTSAAGATAITGCYISTGTDYDVTGTFKLTDVCPYKL